MEGARPPSHPPAFDAPPGASHSARMADRNSRVQIAAVKIMGGLHIALYRATGGRIGGRFLGADNLLLTTIGRKTGKARTTPLIYGRDGGSLVIVASFGGQPQHPAWYKNLSENPKVTVQVRGDLRELVARTATPDERARLWPMMIGLYAGYADYQKKTSREIPIVILS